MPEFDAGERTMRVHRLRHTAMLRVSPSSHRLAKGAGMSSDVGWMEQYSVFTTPQPPSALMPRIAASVAGRP
jgi:hypothetical protein